MKSYLCPESDGKNTIQIGKLFLECCDLQNDSVDASLAVSQWRLNNYTRATEKDFKLFNAAGKGEAFRLFIDILTETYGLEHITEPPKMKVGFLGQTKMLCARLHPRGEKKRNRAFNRKENQLAYLGIRW